MNINIYPHELAEIVTGLLINPDMLVPMSLQQHQIFIAAIGKLVTDLIGGKLQDIEEHGTRVTVRPETSDIWQIYSHVDGGQSTKHHNDIRSRLQSLLSNRGLNERRLQRLLFAMHDVAKESDIFTAELIIDRDIRLKISNKLDVLVMDLMVTIKANKPVIYARDLKPSCN